MTVYVFFSLLLESSTCFYLENEMIFLGTKFPCQACFRTWTYAMLNIPMPNCIPVCYDISFKSVHFELSLPNTYMCCDVN